MVTLLGTFLHAASAWCCRVLVAVYETRQLWIAFVVARHVARRLPILVLALLHGPTRVSIQPSMLTGLPFECSAAILLNVLERFFGRCLSFCAVEAGVWSGGQCSFRGSFGLVFESGCFWLEFALDLLCPR